MRCFFRLTFIIAILQRRRWKFGHPESVHNATMHSLKEEIEKVTSTLRMVHTDLKTGSTKCFEILKDDLDKEGGGFDIYDEENDNDDESNCDDQVTQPLSQSERRIVFEEAYLELCKQAGLMKGEDVGCAEQGLPQDPPVNLLKIHSMDDKRLRRRVKRFNTRNIMWLCNDIQFSNATNQMLDRMWSTALK